MKYGTFIKSVIAYRPTWQEKRTVFLGAKRGKLGMQTNICSTPRNSMCITIQQDYHSSTPTHTRIREQLHHINMCCGVLALTCVRVVIETNTSVLHAL